MTTQIYDVMKLPPENTWFIEASAGTGKTHTLIDIYLRLLLGIGDQTIYQRKLNVQEILVVTFTEAATESLRNRIYENIYRLRLACTYGKSNDPLLSTILTQINDYKSAAKNLLIAEKQMNESAIFTIHTFCYHILKNNSIESNEIFDFSLIKNESLLYQQASADFWRRYCYPLPLEIASIVKQYWAGPDNLLLEILPYLQGNIPVLLYNNINTNESISDCHIRTIKFIDNLKKKWLLLNDNLIEFLKNYKLNHYTYNKKNLQRWLEKIHAWATEPTIDYKAPEELKYFQPIKLIQKTIQGEPPKHDVFDTVENFYSYRMSLKQLIFTTAIKKIQKILEKEKSQNAELGLNDLIKRLDQELNKKNSKKLAELIRTKYPVAMIDEFQDTDPQQYRIFRKIYINQPNCKLLLIGDPKQAIYSFRGADIFTYMHAYKKIKTHYTLNTNWRSATGLTNAVNCLFQNTSLPFIFSDINFIPLLSAKKNSNLELIIQNKLQSAINIWLQPGEKIKICEYKNFMALQCAATISNWLSAAQKEEAWLCNNNKKKIQASDIVILVRNHNEATIMQEALTKLMIPTIYISKRNNVFETNEARNLQWILKAVLNPKNNTILRTALASYLLNKKANILDKFNNNNKHLEKIAKDFFKYNEQWKKYGVLPMLCQMIKQYNIAENLLANPNGEQQLTNLLHLGELLQEMSIQIKDELKLIHWMDLQIAFPNNSAVNQQLRIKNNYYSVKIITIFKSKGLEFPIVFLPFAANFRIQKKPIFHNRKTYLLTLDLNENKESLNLAEEERLAEDLRLLYVAITRSIYHCSIGVAPLYHNNYKKDNSNLHLSAIGYLVQQKKAGNANFLYEQLKILTNRSKGDIKLQTELITPIKLSSIKENITNTKKLIAKIYPQIIYDPWKINSYSNFKHNTSLLKSINYRSDLNLNTIKKQKKEDISELTPHTFPGGNLSGIFLHKIFENLNFNNSIDLNCLNKKMISYGINNIWLSTIKYWIEKIITISFNNKDLILSKIPLHNRHSEFKFHLSVSNIIEAQQIDVICKQYDKISAQCPPLSFSKTKGIIKGYIDLIFYWKNKYYILDYKSNWLGKNNAAYNKTTIKQSMIDNRYDLQYQLYTLALHRHLKHSLIDYCYKKDFGGVYYLFLRGMYSSQYKNSIFYCCPDINLINKLDTLFSNS